MPRLTSSDVHHHSMWVEYVSDMPCTLPEHKEKEQQEGDNQQDQVWHHFGLHVLLIVRCIEVGLKLDSSSWGYLGI